MVQKKQMVIFPKTQEEIAAAESQVLELSKRIEFYLTEYSIELLAQKMEKGEFYVPPYQREFTWEDDRKSRFLESLIIGLPIPFLFFWEMPDGRLEIVDGSQRLRTIQEFILGDFSLGDLESLTLASGFKFIDFPISRQRKINNRSIRGIVLNEHADEQARFDLFDRINTGSKTANPSEIRRGVLAGPCMKLITQLAQDPLFINLAPVSVKSDKEREREELVTRFFAYGDGLDEYRDRPSEFLFNYVKKMNIQMELDPELAPEYEQKFLSTMQFISQVFPLGFRKTANARTTPRARFESIAIGSKLALDQKPDIVDKKIPNVATWIEEEDFKEVTGSDGANAKARLIERTNFVYKKLLGI